MVQNSRPYCLCPTRYYGQNCERGTVYISYFWNYQTLLFTLWLLQATACMYKYNINIVIVIPLIKDYTVQWTDKLYILDTVHSTQYTIYYVHCTLVQCTVCIMYVLCTVYCVIVVYAVPSKLYNVQCTQYTLLADLFIAYYTVYSIYYTVYTIRYTLYSIHYMVSL